LNDIAASLGNARAAGAAFLLVVAYNVADEMSGNRISDAVFNASYNTESAMADFGNGIISGIQTIIGNVSDWISQAVSSKANSSKFPSKEDIEKQIEDRANEVDNTTSSTDTSGAEDMVNEQAAAETASRLSESQTTQDLMDICVGLFEGLNENY